MNSSSDKTNNDKTNKTVPSGPRRWLALSVPPLVLILLVLIGRRVAVSDAAAAASLSSVAPVVGVATVGASDAATDATAETSDAAAEAALSRPLETLADGAVTVDINVANEDELRKLPGIGPGRARKILELRTRLGRFKSVDDLARIKGFGRALVKRLRPLVRIS